MRMSDTILGNLTPVGQDRYGLKWKTEDVLNEVAADILHSTHFQRRARNMTPDFEKAAKVCEEATKMFNTSLNGMLAAETRVVEGAKKTSTGVRKAANELGEGLQRMEKMANFDRLERYVTLMERAAVAMSTLAELQKDGKLEKIANAVK
jgi:hypothetical protein